MSRLTARMWSGREDLNLRHPAPKTEIRGSSKYLEPLNYLELLKAVYINNIKKIYKKIILVTFGHIVTVITMQPLRIRLSMRGFEFLLTSGF